MKVRKSLFAPSRELLDAARDGYETWRAESAAVNAAYHNWTDAPPNERAVAFYEYVAALASEEDAASDYRRLVERAGGV